MEFAIGLCAFILHNHSVAQKNKANLRFHENASVRKNTNTLTDALNFFKNPFVRLNNTIHGETT